MGNDIWVALLSCAGTIIGAFAGVLASNRLTTYRIDRLEDEVRKHNKLVERTYKLESRVSVLEAVE